MEGYWKVYFLTQHKEYDTICERIAKVCDRVVFYHHTGGKKDADRPHIHGLLYNCKKTDKTIREWLRTEFELKVNGGEYAVSREFTHNGKKTKMSELLYPKYIVYMSKGQYDPVYAKDFSEEETSLAKSLWVEKKEEPKTIVIEPKEKVIKKLTLYGIAREAEIRYIMEYPDIPMDEYDTNDMLDIVKKICKENKTLIPKRQMANILQDIMAYNKAAEYDAAVLRMI